MSNRERLFFRVVVSQAEGRAHCQKQNITDGRAHWQEEGITASGFPTIHCFGYGFGRAVLLVSLFVCPQDYLHMINGFYETFSRSASRAR